MKRLVSVAVLVCSTITACNREDPIAVQKWRVSADDLSGTYAVAAEQSRDPVGYLRALDAALKSDSDVARYNRALLQEELFLIRDAATSWNEVLKREPSEQWKEEARKHLAQLNRRQPHWDAEALTNALRRRDVAKIREIATAFPKDAIEYAEKTDLSDLEGLKILGDALAATGDLYVRDIVQAALTTKNEDALRDGVRQLAASEFEQAASSLERAGNPLQLWARFKVAAFVPPDDALAILEDIATVAARYRYRDLEVRARIYRASRLEFAARYSRALEIYRQLLPAIDSPTRQTDVLTRRSANYTTIGIPAEGFRDSFRALQLLPRVANLNARHQAYGSAAKAAGALGYPAIAFQFQSAAVHEVLESVATASGADLRAAKHHLAIALRERADLHIQLGQYKSAEADLAEASELAEAADLPVRPLLNMRLAEVKGEQALRRGRTAEAVRWFTEAIDLAENEHSTYRAVLHYSRALARGQDPAATTDLAAAFEILRDEGARLRAEAKPGEYEHLWKPYFARFRDLHDRLIQDRLDQQDSEGAFLYAERSRAFEPTQLLLQAGSVPPGFRRIETADSLRYALANLADDTLILQYLVLDDRTYSWALSRGKTQQASHRVGRAQIQRWVDGVQRGVASGQDGPIRTAMRAAYDQLFGTLLTGVQYKRIVIVPDGPMHGLPFAVLQNSNGEYIIERSSIAVAGSTSLYLYAVHRDKEFRQTSRPSVLIVGEPVILPQFELGALPNAKAEAEQLHSDYPGSELLMGANATTNNFLAFAQKAAIIHFAGHGIANANNPWLSKLLLAPEGDDSGELFAQKLLSHPQNLGKTRLIVLAACSTASGQSVGSEGLAPLVRPLVAARVPAVVGTLWDVKDIATTKDLLVSFHRHYRNGADVAVALQQAQLAMLRDKEPARQWAPFQAVGYAASPYARHVAQEERHSEHLRITDSLHRPDGLHSR